MADIAELKASIEAKAGSTDPADLQALSYEYRRLVIENMKQAVATFTARRQRLADRRDAIDAEEAVLNEKISAAEKRVEDLEDLLSQVVLSPEATIKIAKES